MSALAIPPNLDTQKDLLDSIGDKLKRVFEEDLDRPIEAQRLTQIALAERNYMYWQGKHYLVPHFDRLSRAVQWESAASSKQGRNPMPPSCYNNVYSDGAKFISIVGQRPVNMKAVSNNPNDATARRMENIIDLAIGHLHRQWNMRAKMQKTAFHNWVTGPVFGHSHYVSDGYRFGWTEEQEIGVDSMTEPSGWRCPECENKSAAPFCAECGTHLGPEQFEPENSVSVPLPGETRRFPKGSIDLDLYSCFYVSIGPFFAESVDKIDHLTLTLMLPPYRGKTADGKQWEQGPSTNMEIAQAEAMEHIEAVASESALDYQRRVVHQKRWITPNVYQAFPEHISKALAAKYPNGLMVEKMGQDLKSAEHERLMDVWSSCRAWTGEHINSHPLTHFIIDPQRDRNSFYNMAREIVLRAIPRTLIDNSLIDEEAWRNKEPIIGEILLSKIGGNQNLRNMALELPTSRMSEHLMPVGAAMREEMREIDGIQPVLFGAGSQQFPTWRQTAQARNSALMQLDPTFENMHRFATDCTWNGVKELQKYGVGTVSVAPRRRTAFSVSAELNLEEIDVEGMHIEPVAGMPSSYGEQIQRVEELVRENPALATTIGLQHPVNIPDIQQMFGVERLYAPGENEQDAALALIQELLQGQPVEDLDPATGKLVQKPSIEPKEFEHRNHALFAEIIRAWANSESGRREAAQNPKGYENVRLHGLAQDQASMMMAQPQGEPPPMPAGGPGPPPPDSTIPPVETGSVGPVEPVQ